MKRGSLLRSRLKVTLVLTVTVLTVSFAAICTVGRIVAWQAPNHEQAINRWIASQGVQVEGLQFRWSGLNPVIGIDKLTAKGVNARDVQFELDFLQSLWRNRISLAALEILELQFEMERTNDGWRPVGSEGNGPGVNALDLIWNSATINVQFEGSLANGSTIQQIDGTVLAHTKGGVRKFFGSVRGSDGCEECGLEFQLQSRKSMIFSDEVFALHATANDMHVQPSLFGLNFLRPLVASGTLELELRDNVGKAQADFEVRGSETSEGSSSFSGTVIASVVKNVMHGLLLNPVLQLDGERTMLPELHVVHRAQTEGLHVWIDSADVQSLALLSREFAHLEHPLHGWATNLSPQGEIENFQLHYDQGNLAFHSLLKNSRTQSYSGVPRIHAEEIELLGYNRNVVFTSNGNNVEFELGSLLEGSKSLENFSGSVLLALAPDLVAVRVDVSDATYQDSQIRARLGFLSDLTTQDVSTGFAIESDGFGVAELRNLIPTNVGETARVWLEEKVQSGRFLSAHAVLHSVNRAGSGANSVVFESRGTFDEAEVVYGPNWPKLEELAGSLWLSRESLELVVESTHSAGIFIGSGRVEVPFGGADLEIDFRADAPMSLALDFIANSPVRELIQFDPTNYTGNGPIDVEAEIRLPMNDGDPSIDLTIGLVEVDLELLAVDLEFQDISGTIRYTSPFEVVSTNLRGTLFGNEVPVRVETTNPHQEDSRLTVSIEGLFTPDDISPYVGDWITEVANGSSEFNLKLDVPVDSGVVPKLTIESDLVGMELKLPEPFVKEPDIERPSHLSMTFADFVSIRFNSNEIASESNEIASEFLLVPGNELIGSIGLNAPPVPLSPQDSGFHVTGQLDSLKIDLEPTQGAFSLPSNLELHNVSSQRVEINDLTFSNVHIDGSISESAIELAVSSDQLVGTATRSGVDRFTVVVDHLEFTEAESKAGDPLTPDVVEWLPNLDLSIKDFVFVETDGDTSSYGSWNMSIDVTDQELQISKLLGEAKGLSIDGGITWNTSNNSTSFNGSVQANQLQDVLTRWDYDPNIESESFSIDAHLNWAGSPLNFDLYATQGSLVGDLKEGRFLELNAAGGALRIVGLLNFTRILDRLLLDFRDVFGEGTRFSRILFNVDLDRGLLRTNNPVTIKTHGSDISFAGYIDMHSEVLDMEVVVTLPVSSSIPWYVGLATGNPVAVITSLAVKKLFEGQIDQFSSSKYRVTGTIEDPKIELVGVFRDSLDDTVDKPEDQTETPNEEPQE